MNTTLGDLLKSLFSCFKKMVNFAWIVFWSVLIVISPLLAAYLSTNGPDFYINYGWVRNHPDSDLYLHQPSIITCMLFDLFCIAMIFAPANNWFSQEKK